MSKMLKSKPKGYFQVLLMPKWELIKFLNVFH